MGVKYRAEFQDINAVDWRIDIDEAGYSGSVNTFKVLTPGFTATWEGDGSRVGENPIRSSKAVVHWCVENSTQESFLEAIATSAELKYNVLIYQGISPTLWWAGTVLPDLCTFENRYYPYAFDLTAVDGLGRLEKLDFTYATNTGNPNDITLGTIITEALKPNKLDTFYGSTDCYIRTSMEWIETNMGTISRSPLQYIRARRTAFIANYDSADNSSLWEPMSCKEALEKVLRSTGCRIEFSRGSYRIYQHQNYRASTYTEYQYTKTGISDSGYKTSATINTRNGATWQSSDLKLTAGSSYTFLPALHKSIAAANRRRMYDLSKAPYDTDIKAANLGDIDTSKPWRLTGKAAVQSTKAVSRLKIHIYRYNTTTNLVTHIVVNDPVRDVNGAYTEIGPVKWHALGTPVSSITGTEIGYNIPAAFNETVNGKVIVDVNIEIPPTATNIGSDIRIQIAGEEYGRAWAYGSPTSGTASWTGVKWNGSLVLEGMVDEANLEWTDEAEFTATNTSSADNSVIQKLENCLIDGSTQLTQGVEIYNNTGSAWQAGSAWKPYSGYSGSANALGQLLANYCIAHHWKPCKVIRGEFRDLSGFLFDFTYAIQHDSEVFISNGGTFTANNARWNGEWIKYQWDDTVFSTAVKLPSKRDTVGTTTKDIKSLQQRLSDIGQMVGGVVTRVIDGWLNTGGSGIGTPTGGDVYRQVITYNTDNGFNPELQSVYVEGDTIQTINANTTLTGVERTVYVDTDSGNVDITLCDAADFPAWERLVIVKTKSGNTMNIIAGTGDTINGAGSKAYTAQWAGAELMKKSNNEWVIVP